MSATTDRINDVIDRITRDDEWAETRREIREHVVEFAEEYGVSDYEMTDSLALAVIADG